MADLGDLAATSTVSAIPGRGRIGPPPAARQPERFDVVYCSNVYHLLDPGGRAALRATVGGRLVPRRPVLHEHPVAPRRDPRHAGHGRPVPGEPGSWVEQTYLHLCRRDELERDFGFLRLERLDEIAYLEPRPEGAPHDHVSWIVVGRAP